MTTIVKIKGRSINLGGTDYVVPPLNLSSLEQLQDKLTNFTGGADIKQVGIVADVAHAALKRNYPDLTREELCDLIDLGNMGELMEAVMGVSGLVKQDGPEGEALGTAKE